MTILQIYRLFFQIEIQHRWYNRQLHTFINSLKVSSGSTVCGDSTTCKCNVPFCLVLRGISISNGLKKKRCMFIQKSIILLSISISYSHVFSSSIIKVKIRINLGDFLLQGTSYDGSEKIQLQLRSFDQVRLEAVLVVCAWRRCEEEGYRVNRVSDVADEYSAEQQAN